MHPGFDRAVKLSSSTFIFDQQRIEHMSHFNRAILNPSDSLGVMYTGPNGVGKSAIAFGCFLLAFAQSRPTVYIPKADKWVLLSRSEDNARDFFMKAFFNQNADLIYDRDELKPFFKDQLEGKPVSKDAYTNFATAVEEGLVGPCNFIVDEAQKLLHAVTDSERLLELGFASAENNKTFFAKVFVLLCNGFSENFVFVL